MMKRIYETLHINDECYTPDYAVRPLLKYLEQFKGKTIWCPFDTEESEYVKILTAEGHKVLFSHKDSGDNFYDFGDGLFAQDMPEFDLIVSNPPFHNKALLVEKIIQIGKPFALLLPLTWLNDSAPFRLFSKGGGRTYIVRQAGKIQKLWQSAKFRCRILLPWYSARKNRI